MTAKENKFLVLGSNAVMTPIIEPVVVSLEPYFEEAKLKATIMSGLRTPEDQLRIIRQYLNQKGLSVKYPETMEGDVAGKFVWQEKEVFSWQPGWSALLNSGIIINPPVKAICLMDYVNKLGVNKKGSFIAESNHFYGGCVDIGGGTDGDISNELKVVNKAMPNIKAIISIVIERNNNCIHLNCKKI